MTIIDLFIVHLILNRYDRDNRGGGGYDNRGGGYGRGGYQNDK